MTQMPDADALLMGRGTKSINWKNNPVGYTVVGTIVDQPRVEQVKKYNTDELQFWPSGDPMLQIVVTLQTEERDPADPNDDGKRRLHISPRMQHPVHDAVQRANAPGLRIGGRIAVQRTGGTGETGSPFEFAADYAPPAVDPGSLLANGNGHTPPVATTPPVTAPVAAPTASPTLGSMLAGNSTTPAADAVPPGVDPQVWEGLPAAQKQAIRTAMSNPAASVAPF